MFLKNLSMPHAFLKRRGSPSAEPSAFDERCWPRFEAIGRRETGREAVSLKNQVLRRYGCQSWYVLCQKVLVVVVGGERVVVMEVVVVEVVVVWWRVVMMTYVVVVVVGVGERMGL